jgi:carboxymethylenebutenolidase
MQIFTEFVDIPSGGSPMRLLLAQPKAAGRYPGILLYSDIFQLTGSTIRAVMRFAGYGYVVAAPEIYHRIEPPGSALAFDDAGRDRGLANAAKTTVAEFDEDARSVIEWLKNQPSVAPGQLGAAGFCIGGHLACRAALHPEVKATVCFYPTGVDNGKLGKDADAGTLTRLADIRGEILVVFGTLDPHVSEDGRAKVRTALEQAGVRHSIQLYEAEHAFMRDEGPRYDSQASDLAFSEAISLFQRVFATGK